jgi:BirA family biotin operon repressor/biotin-[acetyl-CoA-carboxylase] ligase
MKSVDARILKLLRSTIVHLPGGEIARESGCSAATVESRIAGLRAAGYDIEKRPHLGYRLVAAPDRLIADDLLAALDGRRLAREIIVFEKTGSTNDVAAHLGRGGAEEGLVVFAEHQTAGRGRLGRRWQSASHHGLWFSILLRPTLELSQWTRLTTWAAVGVAEAIEECAGCKAMIKWPNDICIDRKKAVGILVESFSTSPRRGFAVVGIGVNANQESFPEAPGATSLRMVSGKPADRMALAVAILKHLDDSYGNIADGFGGIIRRANKRSFLRNRRIQVKMGSASLRGVAGGLDPEGGLVVRLEGGGQTTVSSGEATIVMRHGRAGGGSLPRAF